MNSWSIFNVHKHVFRSEMLQWNETRRWNADAAFSFSSNSLRFHSSIQFNSSALFRFLLLRFWFFVLGYFGELELEEYSNTERAVFIYLHALLCCEFVRYSHVTTIVECLCSSFSAVVVTAAEISEKIVAFETQVIELDGISYMYSVYIYECEM